MSARTRVIDMTSKQIPQSAHSDSLTLSNDAWDWWDDYCSEDYVEEDFEAERSFRDYDPYEDDRQHSGLYPIKPVGMDFDPFLDLSLSAWENTQPKLRQRSGKKMFWDWMKEFRGMPRQSFCKRMFNRFARRNGKEEIRLEMLTAVPSF